MHIRLLPCIINRTNILLSGCRANHSASAVPETPAPGSSNGTDRPKGGTDMKPNFFAAFFKGKPKPETKVISVTSERTGERTLLGVENFLGSIAVPTLLPGDSRGRRRRHPAGALSGLLLRPPATGGPLPPRPGERGIPAGRSPTPSSGGAGLVHKPAAAGSGVPAPAHFPRRRPAGPGFRPLISVIGSLSDLESGSGWWPASGSCPWGRLVPSPLGEAIPQATARPGQLPV